MTSRIRVVRILVVIVTAYFTLNFSWGQTTTVVVSPASKNVLPSRSLTLNVVVNNVLDLHLYHVIFNFDNSILRYDGVTSGSFLSGQTVFFPTPPPGPSVNSVTVDEAILGTGTVSGSGVLFSIQFTSLQLGTSPVALVNVTLRNGVNQNIPATLTSGVVTCAYPAETFVDPAYMPGSAGGNDFGFDAFSTFAGGIDAVNAGGTVNVSSATYSETDTITKNLTLTRLRTTGTPAIQSLTITSNSRVTLGSNFQINNTLRLSSGVLVTGTNKIVIANTAPEAVVITGGSVNGEMERTIAGGSIGTYKFTDLNTHIVPDGAQGAMSVSIKSFPNTTPPNITTGRAINRYYTVTPSTGLTATLRLAYLESELNGIAEGDLELFRFTGSSWVAMGGAVNLTDDYMELMGVSTWLTWTIADATDPLPIQLSSFTGTVVNGADVLLEWTTLSEVNNYGFEVQKSADGVAQYQTVPNSFIPGHGTTNVPHTYRFTDVSVSWGNWYYRLKQIDLDGTVHYTNSIQVQVLTDVKEDRIPTEFRLKQNYPNPFNPATTIEFTLPKTSKVSLKVFSMLGQLVTTLVDDELASGKHAVRFDASCLSSGTYVVGLRTEDKYQTAKITLIK